MSKIYFKDGTGQQNESIELGDFVRVPENNLYYECEFGIVALSSGYWTVVDLNNGKTYIDKKAYPKYCGWTSKKALIKDLHPQLITKPFVIEPGDPE